jgi:G3E family GTPase
MQSEIIIISGFLGAGKTTLIQAFLKKLPSNEKVVLVENDFGDISVDAALLKSGGIEVREINAGCICCSLSGDFIKAMKELLERYHPDKVIIEPSGVGKLSDIVKACSDPLIVPLAKVISKITVADVNRYKMYLDNFGEFFEDQIENADLVLLNRTEESTEKAASARGMVKELNPRAVIFGSMDELLSAYAQKQAQPCQCPHCRAARGEDAHNHGHSHSHSHEKHVNGAGEPCGHAHNHGHVHSHDHGCACGCGHDHDHAHDHAAEDIFDTVTIHTEKVFQEADLRERMTRLEKAAKGTLLRAKGIVRGPRGYLNLQYVPGDVQITDCAAPGDMICFIGRNLSKEGLTGLFA